MIGVPCQKIYPETKLKEMVPGERLREVRSVDEKKLRDAKV
jgi:hypothetical protein